MRKRKSNGKNKPVFFSERSGASVNGQLLLSKKAACSSNLLKIESIAVWKVVNGELGDIFYPRCRKILSCFFCAHALLREEEIEFRQKPCRESFRHVWQRELRISWFSELFTYEIMDEGRYQRNRGNGFHLLQEFQSQMQIQNYLVSQKFLSNSKVFYFSISRA